MIDLAHLMYVHEPCRICGRLLTEEDVKGGAVFVGYSDDSSSRAAHKYCWDSLCDVLRKLTLEEIVRIGREEL